MLPQNLSLTFLTRRRLLAWNDHIVVSFSFFFGRIYPEMDEKSQEAMAQMKKKNQIKEIWIEQQLHEFDTFVCLFFFRLSINSAIVSLSYSWVAIAILTIFFFDNTKGEKISENNAMLLMPPIFLFQMYTRLHMLRMLIYFGKQFWDYAMYAFIFIFIF